MSKAFAYFTTIQFKISQLSKIGASLDKLLSSTRLPVYAQYEQRGNTQASMGGGPHLHIISVGEFSHSHFSEFSDIVSLPKTKWMVADLLFRYLQGYKKDAAREWQVTNNWRSRLDLQCNRWQVGTSWASVWIF